jgi:gluconate 2-dehydrogenase alpha chain
VVFDGAGTADFSTDAAEHAGGGSQWKKAVAHYYNRSFWVIGLHDHLSFRGNYLDLDPNYRDMFRNPLWRMTYDIGPNDHRLSRCMVKVAENLAKVLKPSYLAASGLPDTFEPGAPYGIIHQIGGAITGTTPENSVVNKYLQSWDISNLSIVGASAFPQIPSFNPTGTVGALAYFAARAIKIKYLRNPGPLI